MAIWLNEQDVRASLTMADLIPAMRQGLVAFSSGEVTQPVRSVIEWGRSHSFFASMPASAPTIPALGAKLVTVAPGNAAKGLPTHLATIVLLDSETGEPRAFLDGRYITEARTAAVSALAAHLLGRSESRILAILGTGVQARSHLEALRLVHSYDLIRCWSPTPAHVRAFAEEHQTAECDSAESAVRGADVIALVTASAEPVLRNDWVDDGACVLSIGACRPDQREVDPALVARSRLLVDSRASALRESGDVLLGIREGRFTASHIAAELGEAILDPTRGRRSPEEVVVFKSLGLAVEDLAAAHLAYTRAIQAGRGVRLA